MIFLVLNILTICNCSKAVQVNNINISASGDCGNLLKYKGMIIKTYYAEFIQNNNSFPAYCLDKTKQGVNSNLSYSVNMQENIKDIKLWRIIVNGYPYKTYEELRCQNKEEAYTATKQAIYTYIHGNDVNGYTAIGEAGNRTLNALKQIVNNANNSSEIQTINQIHIEKESDNFEIDNIDEKYVSKIYCINSKASMSDYKITLDKNNLDKIKLVDLENKEKSEFSANEKFKILIPITNLKQDGKIYINITTRLNTKPILYGKAENSSYQDYALTGIEYEDTIENLEDVYTENKTAIKIIKQDRITKESLSKVSFNILNEEKEIIYCNLETNEEGVINVEGILPGKYYIQETNSKEGYILDDELYEINVKYNELINITIENNKEPEEEIIKPTLEIANINIKKLPKTGM